MFIETALALRFAVEALTELKAGHPPPLGEDEMLAAKRLVTTCREIVALVTEEEIEAANLAVEKEMV